MKFYCLLIISLLLVLNSFAQVKKRYIDSKGVFTTDLHKAVSYVLIEKLIDSGYSLSKYDLHDTIILNGTFKDSLMRIPHGKFIYYTKWVPNEKLKDVLHIDTNNFISIIGYFANGLKTGMWVEFERKGIKKCSYIYQNGKMNGLFQMYNRLFNNYVTEEGYYINDKREGIWNGFGYDTVGTPVFTAFYKNDKIKQQQERIKAAKLPGGFDKRFLKQLRPQIDSLKSDVRIGITIKANGEVTDIKIIDHASPSFDHILFNALQKLPKFQPQMNDGKPVDSYYSLIISRDQPNRYFDLTLAHEVGNGLSFQSFQSLF